MSVNLEASSSETPGFRPIETKDKGRCLIANRQFEPGDVVLIDHSFLRGSWHQHLCIECDSEHPSTTCEVVKDLYSNDVWENMDIIENELADMELIGDIDRARLLIKALRLATFAEPTSSSIPACPEFKLSPIDQKALSAFSKALYPLFSLSNVRMRECMETAQEIFNSDLKFIVPEGMSKYALAKIIGILNTNSHELGHYGGSGVFLTASLMEHSCDPNCSFTTGKNKLWINAIQPIKKDDPLSIDYKNFYYDPTEARQEELQRCYQFTCKCSRCVSAPDLCRAFRCQRCKDDGVDDSASSSSSSSSSSSVVVAASSIISTAASTTIPSLIVPAGDGKDLSSWKCQRCQTVMTENEAKRLLQEERKVQSTLEFLDEMSPKSAVNLVDETLATSSLAESHYLLFRILESVGKSIASMAKPLEEKSTDSKQIQPTPGQSKNNKNNNKKNNKKNKKRNSKNKKVSHTDEEEEEDDFVDPEGVWLRVLESMKIVVPEWHSENCIAWDMLAQIRILKDNVEGARESYLKALKVAKVVHGRDALTTRELTMLSRCPPQNKDQMIAHYSDPEASIQKWEKDGNMRSNEGEMGDPVSLDGHGC